MTEKKSPYSSDIKGRTISEMIGVLAIVGILSIGALAGYKTVHNKIEENKVLKEAMRQGTELRLKAKHLLNASGEIVWDEKSNFIVSRKHDATTNSLVLETKPLTPEICASLVSSKEEGFFSDVTCNSTNVLTFKVPLKKAFVVAGKDDIGYTGVPDYDNLIPDNGNTPPVSDEVISCPVEYDCTEENCCVLSGTKDFCGNPSPIYYETIIQKVNNSEGCLVDNEVCWLDDGPAPEDEEQRCEETCTADGRCIQCSTGVGFGNNITNKDCLTCKDGEEIFTAPNGKGFYCCPTASTGLVWDAVSYHCCMGDEVPMVIPSRSDSICCPKGTIEAVDNGDGINDYECITECSRSSKAVENCATYDNNCACTACADGYDLENGECEKAVVTDCAAVLAASCLANYGTVNGNTVTFSTTELELDGMSFGPSDCESEIDFGSCDLNFNSDVELFRGTLKARNVNANGFIWFSSVHNFYAKSLNVNSNFSLTASMEGAFQVDRVVVAGDVYLNHGAPELVKIGSLSASKIEYCEQLPPSGTTYSPTPVCGNENCPACLGGCPAGQTLMEAPNDKGSSCCPTGNTLAWDGTEFHCCGNGQVATVIPERDDSICCPAGTERAYWYENEGGFAYHCTPQLNCPEAEQNIENCDVYDENCACKVCADGYTLNNGACSPISACVTTSKFVENCAEYDADCNCSTCKEGYQNIGSGLCRLKDDTILNCTNSSGEEWTCSNDIIPSNYKEPNFGASCGKKKNECCLMGECCTSPDSFLADSMYFACCPTGTVFATPDGEEDGAGCCDLTKNVIVDGHCCPPGSIGTRDFGHCYTCADTEQAIEHCLTYGEGCACTECEQNYELNETTGQCDPELNGSAESLACKQAMLDAGISEDMFTVSGTTITLKAQDFDLEGKALVLSDCTLTGANSLRNVTIGGGTTVSNIPTIENALLGMCYIISTSDVSISNSEIRHANISAEALTVQGCSGEVGELTGTSYLTISNSDFENITTVNAGELEVMDSKIGNVGTLEANSIKMENNSGITETDKLIFSCKGNCTYMFDGLGLENNHFINTKQFCSNSLASFTNASGSVVSCTNIGDCTCPADCAAIATTINAADCSVGDDGVTITCLEDSSAPYNQYTITGISAPNCNLVFPNASVWFNGSNVFNDISITNAQTASFTAVGISGSLKANNMKALHTEDGKSLGVSDASLYLNNLEVSGALTAEFRNSTVEITGKLIGDFANRGSTTTIAQVEGSYIYNGYDTNNGNKTGSLTINKFKGGEVYNSAGSLSIDRYCGKILYKSDAPLANQPQCSDDCQSCACGTDQSSSGYLCYEPVQACTNNTACGTNGYCSNGTCVECTGEQVPTLTFDGCETLTVCDSRTETSCTGTGQCGVAYTCTPERCVSGTEGTGAVFGGGVCSNGYCEYTNTYHYDIRYCPAFDADGNFIGVNTEETAAYWSDTCLEWNTTTGPTGNRITTPAFDPGRYHGSGC